MRFLFLANSSQQFFERNDMRPRSQVLAPAACTQATVRCCLYTRLGVADVLVVIMASHRQRQIECVSGGGRQRMQPTNP